MKLNHLINQRGGSKTDTIVKLILVFFISLLSFSVGTFVGKQFSDSQHRLASLENEYNKDSGQSRSTASIPGDGIEVEPSEILSNEDVAKLAEEFVQEKKPTEHKAERTVANTESNSIDIELHNKPAAGNKPIDSKMPSEEKSASEKAAKSIAERSGKKVDEYHGKDLNQKAAEKIASNKAPLEAVAKPADTKKAMADLPATVSADAKGKYTIQVSSHQTETEAKSRVSDLNSKGYVASYISANVDGKSWYRVGVGTFGTVKSAKEYLEKIKENPSFKGAIVRQIVQ
ncbi:MAG: SPOR domain-containing protein [Bdellovibrionota bacterium]